MDANANNTTEPPVMEESLSSYFHKSASIVKQYADLIEQDYAQPILRYASRKFGEKPITMTFLSVFAGLSLLPVLSFIGLTIFTFASVVFFVLASTTIAFITIEAVLVICLFFVLWSLFIVASVITTTIIFVYWSTRLGLLVTYQGPSGVTDWTRETQQYFFRAKAREPTEDSDESAVLVDKDSPSFKKIKVEDEALPNN